MVMTYLIALVLGACIGSFLNVCMDRWPREESVLLPASQCAKCKRKLPWSEKLPVISYLLLRGRCRSCGEKIRFRILGVEILSAAIGVLLYLLLGWSVALAWWSFFVGGLLIAIVTDLEHGIIPDEVPFYGILFAWIVSFFYPGFHGEQLHRLGLADSVLGMLAGGMIMIAAAWLGELILRRECMGGGDIKLMAMIGAFTGAKAVFVVFLLAPILSIPVGLVTRFILKQKTFPFGPYIALAGILALWQGDEWFRLIFYF